MTPFASKSSLQTAATSGQELHSAQPICRSLPATSVQPKASVQGVLVSSQPANTVARCHDAVLRCQKVDNFLLQDSALGNLLLPKMLGLPLKFVKWPIGGANYNHLIQVLSIDVGWLDLYEQLEEIGVGQTPYPPIRGSVMLVREDGQILREKHVEALAVYINNRLTEIIRFGGGRWKHRTMNELRALAKRLAEKLTPEALVAFWKSYQTMKVKAGDKDWEGVECPVKVDASATSAEAGDKSTAKVEAND